MFQAVLRNTIISQNIPVLWLRNLNLERSLDDDLIDVTRGDHEDFRCNKEQNNSLMNMFG